jgi:pimeloyl-ACP methyl ester carboxylesterase
MGYYAIDKNLTIGELRFHYRDWGGHGWPILLLHGLASTSHIWDLVAPLLVEDARAIALDLRGHGQSDKPDSNYDFETVVDDVIAALKELQMEHPVVVGHSWGAMVGLWMAANYPDSLSGLVMVDGGLVDMGTQGSWEQTLERLAPPKLDGLPVAEFRTLLVDHAPQGLVTPAAEAAILANFEIDGDEKIHPRLPRAYHERILRAMWEQRIYQQYEKVACPTLLLPVRWREQDDPNHVALKEAGAAKAEELIADVEVAWLEDTIHDVPLQKPHLVADHIKLFLTERL